MHKAGGSPNCWDSMAPTPVVEASTSTMNGTLGSEGSLEFLEGFVGIGVPGQGLGFFSEH